MKIRLAEYNDLNEIQRIYQCARNYMEMTGNKNQWIDGYPLRELIEQDIENKQCYVCVYEYKIHGVFMFAIGEDATYGIIEGGAWENDHEPYGTIHRLASDGEVKGVFSHCLQFCKGEISNLRADTHEDNKTMQYLLEKNGFSRCGIIYTGNKSPRIAYQYFNTAKK